MYGKISQARYHHSHFTEDANVENEYSNKCVLIAHAFEGAKGDDTLSYDFCGISVSSEHAREVLLPSNDIHPSRERDRKGAGVGRKPLTSTNQQGGAGDKSNTIDYFSLKRRFTSNRMRLEGTALCIPGS